MSCVLGEDAVAAFQNPDGPVGDVLEVADRRGDEVEAGARASSGAVSKDSCMVDGGKMQK